MDNDKHRQNGVVLLAGGGIDSSLCMQMLRAEGKSVRALHVSYGQPASSREWVAVRSLARHFDATAEQVKVGGSLRYRAGEQLGRNLAFISLGLTALDAEGIICIGIHAGTPFYDCSRSFFDQVRRLVAEHTDGQVRLIAPLLELTKPEIVSHARQIELPLYLTYSCQLGDDRPCGRCHSCKDREALAC